MDPNELAKLDHATLYRLRSQAREQELQDLLAGYEHRAFGREAVSENPWLALPILTATPVYQAAKLIPGLLQSRSNPSWSQLGQGLLGVGEGLRNAIQR